MKKPKTVKQKAADLKSQTMLLKDYVDNAIWAYPTIYRASTYERSRILVLGHVFLGIGTGLEWHPNGFLSELGYTREGDSKYNIVGPKELPKDFFDINLWELSLMKKDLPAVKKALKGHLYYLRPRCLHGELSVIYEANKELATEITLKYSADKDSEYRVEMRRLGRETLRPREVRAYCGFDGKEKDYEPYPMCDYSPLAEMVKRKTNSLHIDNFELKEIMPDWIQGGIEIARYTLDYYRDDEKVKASLYHPSQALRSFKEFYDQDPEKFRKERVADGMKPEHTIEEWCEICWQKFRKEQIKYCEKFLKMYAPNAPKIS